MVENKRLVFGEWIFTKYCCVFLQLKYNEFRFKPELMVGSTEEPCFDIIRRIRYVVYEVTVFIMFTFIAFAGLITSCKLGLGDSTIDRHGKYFTGAVNRFKVIYV